MTKILLKLFARKPRYGVAFGIFFVLLFGGFGIKCLVELRDFSSGPQPLSMEEAFRESSEKEIYVKLTDAVTSCANALIYNRNLYLPVKQREDGAALIIASYDSPKRCAKAEGEPITGTMKPLVPRLGERLANEGMLLAPEVRSVCGNCGPENSRIGAIICGLLTLLAFSIIPLSFLLNKKHREGRLL